MSKMDHVLAVPEQAIVVCNGYLIHVMKPIDVLALCSSQKNPKVQKSNLAHFGLKPAIVSLRKPCPWEKSSRILITPSYLNTTPKVLIK